MNALLPRTLLAASLALGAMLPALADGGRAMPRSVPPAYTQECASCHVAYSPSMLPARSWQRVMSGLERHYGTDASLDAATLQQLSTWLQSYAGTYKRVAEEPPQDRITRSAWFERKHRKVEPAVWQLPSVKSAANCATCHTGAEQGRFSDDDLRMPAGLSARQRQAWAD
ncbi:diheme cytochrome c [Piscinibacter gummiphilus]